MHQRAPGAAPSQSQPQSLTGRYLAATSQADDLVKELAKWFKFVRALVYLGAWSLSLIAEVLLHRRLGERYLTPIPVVIATLILLVWAGQMPRFDNPGRFTVEVIGSGFLLLAMLRWGWIRIRAMRGVHVYSRSAGLPFFVRWLPGAVGPMVTLQIIEPGVLVAAAAVLWATGNAACGLPLAIAAALVLKTAIQAGTARGQELDRRDTEQSIHTQ